MHDTRNPHHQGGVARGGSLRATCRYTTLVGFAALMTASLPPSSPAAHRTMPAALAFRDVTVIDVTDGRRQPHQTVVVVGTRIQAIGPAATVAVPAGAQEIDAAGKYLLPGFWDMHAHVDDNVQQRYPRYIGDGVTGIREMAQRGEFPDSFRIWQREVAAGTRIGPRAFGPSADLSVRNTEGDWTLPPTEVRRVVDSLKAAGDLFIKDHGSFRKQSGFPDPFAKPSEEDAQKDRELFFALMREARRAGLPVVGHLHTGVTAVEAADSGLRSFEHTLFAHKECFPWPAPIPQDSAALERACAPLARAYVRNGSWMVPTLATEYPYAFSEQPYFPNMWQDEVRFWRLLHRLGVRQFLAGTDCTSNVAREELILLTDIGLTPLEALQAGTLNPAIFFNAADSLGTVAPGKLADLVLLDADPLADIANVMQLWGVVANGRYFDRATLERMAPPEKADWRTSPWCQ